VNRARWKEIDEQFRQAIDLPEAARIRFVRELLVRNPELGRAVKDLLASAAEAEAVLGESAAVFAGPLLAGLDDEEWDALYPGAIVGGYRLLRELGRGGQSTVYLAEPANTTFGTRVAVKVLARGPDTDAIIGGLHHVRDALAGLAHRGIARFLDGGATAAGLPYLVIELVDGRPLLAYCDERRLDIPARLGLLLQVCAAVQHAHQHFVAHSDLTASRILVSDQGTAKIMEFGTARLLQPGPVTTADDVLSLGVLLHQLLTGKLPPSTSATLRKDLDAIVARALEQDPSGCYASAGALADDIRRALAQRPVQARPSSPAYRTSRFVLRHRTPLGIAALALLAALPIAGITRARLSGRPMPVVAVTDAPIASREKPPAQPPPPGSPATGPLPEQRQVMASTEPPLPPASTASRGDGQSGAAAPALQPLVPARAAAVRITSASAMPRRSAEDSAAMLSELAQSFRTGGKRAEAETALRQALSLTALESLAAAERQWELGDLLRVERRYGDAEPLLRSSLLVRQRLTTRGSAEVGQSLAGLAMLQCEQGRTAESDSLFQQAIAIFRRLPTDAGGLRMPETDRAQCR
jgi:eukaryotic-like serine/threonine-protein kinase